MAITDEKAHVDHVGVSASSDDTEARSDKNTSVAVSDFGFSPDEQRKIIRRIDRRLVITVGAMYCVSLMDRTNLGAANIAGMGKELMLIGNRYSVITLVFFVTYICFQPPSTVIIRRVGPRFHLSIITVLWGAVMIGMGFVKSWDQMAALRVILGIMEAGFFPSCVYLLSTWYTRYEVGKRYSMFYLVGCLASAFSGILAYGVSQAARLRDTPMASMSGHRLMQTSANHPLPVWQLMQMNGLANLTGWRWIFIIEGALTCLLGIAGYWLLVDFPDSKRKSWAFLGERERAWICARVEADRGDAKVLPFNLKRFFSAGSDWKIWIYALIFFNSTTITYALAYFLPIILTQRMGFDVGAAQCLVSPPYAFAGIVMFGLAWYSDKYRRRGAVIVINMLLCVIGLPIVGFAESAAARYFGVFLVTAGANSNIPAAMSYQANNIRGQWKRAFCSATLVGFGGIGGIAGSLVFRSQDAPFYRPGLYACLACASLNIILVGIMTLNFRRLNAQADRGERELEDSDVSVQTPMPAFSRLCHDLTILVGGLPTGFPLHLLDVDVFKRCMWNGQDKRRRIVQVLNRVFLISRDTFCRACSSLGLGLQVHGSLSEGS
jgi:MFS family permease